MYYRRDYVFKTTLNSEGTLNRKRDYGLKNTLNSEGTEGVEEGEGLVNTSRMREKRGKTQEV